MPEWLTAIIALLALGLSGYNFHDSRRRKHRRLVNAIYHHADAAVHALGGLQDNNNSLRQKIESDSSFTPYVLCSDADDLTYDQIIEIMELLDKSEEKVVLSYFYNEAELHAYAKSFDLEFVRCWPSERKLRLWEEYEKSQKKTHKDAIRTVCILKKHLD